MKADEITIREILVVFFRMERTEDLFSLKLSDGTHYWDIVRRDVYLTLHTLHGGPFALPRRLLLPPLKDKAKDLVKPILNWLSRRYLTRKAPQYIFFTVQRIRQGDRLIDTLSDHLYRLLSKSAVAVELANNSAIDYWRLLIGTETRNLPVKIGTPRFDAEVIEVAKVIERTVLKHFGTTVDLRQLVIDAIWRHREIKKYYQKVFSSFRPKVIIAVNIANQSGIVEVAKELGIRTVELQHGGSSSHTITWSYPESVPPSHPGLLVPTAYFTFADYWNSNTHYPVALFRSIGNDYMFQEESRSVGRDVLFISSYMYREPLLKIAIEMADLDKTRTVHFKLHPHELDKKASVVAAFGERSNIVAVENDVEFAQLFELCEYVVGVQSTVLYTALQARKKVCILKISNYFWHQDIFEYVELFDTSAQLDHITGAAVGTFFQRTDSAPVMYQRFNPQHFKQALHDVEHINRAMSDDAIH